MAVIWSMFRAGVSSMKIGGVLHLVIGLGQLVQLAIIESPARCAACGRRPATGAEQPLAELEIRPSPG